MRRFNEWLAVRGTGAFGTMWAFYVFTVYGLLPVLFPAARDQLLYWSNVIQLVALPLIMVGQVVQGRAAEDRDQETHDAVMAELAELKEMHSELRAQSPVKP
ncbi:hypothetical protein [Amycolatopsis sp. CFH S0078]|uniref:hypothetical protein n=1 Tax=Amycolatopsis sp. CFH S0078 TaxID=1644108 RepID=UPI00106E4B9B|nr:hypothetical protein [Amycolatopsis sp. CFH S0078]